MSNYKFIFDLGAQAWGVAFREGTKVSWCYGSGPAGKLYTERAAKFEAFMSNNGEDGPFMAVPIPDRLASYDFANEFDPGPRDEKTIDKMVAYRQGFLK